MATVTTLPLSDDRRVDRFQDYQLRSAFQPIFGLSHSRAVGYEALIRPYAKPDRPVSPAALFQTATAEADRLVLDEKCQQLHIRNFAETAPADRWLFLNLDPATVVNRRYRDGSLTRAMRTAGLPFERLVIEILEAADHDEALLLEAVGYFRSLGAMVALDDFGAGHSNFHRIWRLAPDFIKLDRAIIVEAEQHVNGKLRRMLPNLVALMHEAGSLVVVEGVETEAQALIALDADADFVQGFYFARPAEHMREHAHAVPALDRLGRRFAQTVIDRGRQDAEDIALYVATFRSVVRALEASGDTEATVQPLLALPRTARCYVLDEMGAQRVLFGARGLRAVDDERARPVADSSGGTWFRRQYFRDAINQPRRLQISRPYLSHTGARMCVTLSVANGEYPQRVFCCDVYCA